MDGEWAPREYEGLQEFLPVSDLILLRALKFDPSTANLEYSQNPPTELSSDELKAIRTLEVMTLASQVRAINERLNAIQDAILESGDSKAIMALGIAQSRIRNLVASAGYLIWQDLSQGMIQGATDEVLSGFAVMRIADEAGD